MPAARRQLSVFGLLDVGFERLERPPGQCRVNVERSRLRIVSEIAWADERHQNLLSQVGQVCDCALRPHSPGAAIDQSGQLVWGGPARVLTEGLQRLRGGVAKVAKCGLRSRFAHVCTLRGPDISTEGSAMAKALYTAQAHVELVRAAHQVCPYSNATRGNIDVALTANGQVL